MRSFFYLALILLPTAAFSMGVSDWDLAEPHKVRCSSSNQIGNNFCIADEYKTTDIELNKLYKKLLLALADPKPLKKSQQKWLSFRDAQCKLIVGEENGSEYPYSINACLIDLTEKRILDLKSIQPCNGCVLFKDEYYKDGKWP